MTLTGLDTVASARRSRPNRSQLVAPGSSARFIEKAAGSRADVVLLDLEDAVAIPEKASARARVVTAINQIDWGRKSLSVRINAPDTPFMYRDLIDIAEQAGPRLDLIMVPKIGCPADVHMLDVLLSQIEAATGRASPIGLELQIETAEGLARVEAIAAASPRIESLHFGPGDFAASVGARTTSIGGPTPDYAVLGEPDSEGRRIRHPGDLWHYALSRILVAARASGVRAIDGPYGDFGDAAGLEAGAARAAAMGFDGKWAIHPSQIDTINAAFSPGADEIERAQGIIDALENARSAGRGATVFEGRMIDIASIRQARALVERARATSDP